MRAWRRDVRVFSSASDAPRSRRPTDVVLLALAVVTVTVLTFPAPGPTTVDSLVTGLVKALPGLFGWFWEISWDLLIAWTVLLVALPLFARGRRRQLLEELLAGALAVGLALVAGGLAGTSWPDSLRAFGASGSPAVYLAVRLALATAVLVMAAPYMARPFRYAGRLVLGLGAAAGIALGTSLPIGMVVAFAVGIGSAAVVHLVFGSPAGRLTLGQVAGALADLGVDATGLRQAPLEPRGVAVATAEAPDGRSLLVKTYGRDAWDGRLLASEQYVVLCPLLVPVGVLFGGEQPAVPGVPAVGLDQQRAPVRRLRGGDRHPAGLQRRLAEPGGVDAQVGQGAGDLAEGEAARRGAEHQVDDGGRPDPDGEGHHHPNQQASPARSRRPRRARAPAARRSGTAAPCRERP